MKKIIYLLIILVCGTVFFLYKGYVSAIRYSGNPQSRQRVSVIIPEGSSGDNIAGLLYKKELIKSPFFFNFYLKQNNLEQKLKAGNFVFEENFDMKKIIETLIEGKTSEFSVTLLEGWTIGQMADYLEEQGLTTRQDFMECARSCTFDFSFLPQGYLEGYLYPDTYFVNPASYSDKAFIKRLIQTFQTRLTDTDWAAIEASKRSFEDIMIMASIVEREERNENEKKTVAGILWNRLDANMGLGADATVLYGLGRTSGGLSAKDLASDSPYNTRKFAGLPPTPICNPSVSSIRAALYPENTDYWYYLHDSDGKIHYARTLEQHNVNKAKYIY